MSRVLIGGHVKTPSGWAEAIAIRSGVITGVGTDASVLTQRGPRTEVIDLKGATVAVQGFGNVGAIGAQLMAEHGAKIVGVTDWKGGVYNAKGLDVPVGLTRSTDSFYEGERKPEIIEKFRMIGSEPVGGTPETVQKFFAEERVRWKRAVDMAKLQKL